MLRPNQINDVLSDEQKVKIATLLYWLLVANQIDHCLIGEPESDIEWARRTR